MLDLNRSRQVLVCIYSKNILVKCVKPQAQQAQRLLKGPPGAEYGLNGLGTDCRLQKNMINSVNSVPIWGFWKKKDDTLTLSSAKKEISKPETFFSPFQKKIAS